MYDFYNLVFYQHHTVSRTKQDRQREPNVKTLRSPSFRRILALRAEGRNCASTPERINGKNNLNKYLISSNRNRTHNQSLLQSHFAPLGQDCPQ